MTRKIEDNYQKAVVRWFRIEYPDATLFAIWNEGISGSKGAIYGKHRKDMGVVAGIPDLFLAHPGCNGQRGLFIEMKADNGKLLPSQKKMIPKLDRYYDVAVCYHPEEAMSAIRVYMGDGYAR